jgi:signal peptidase I
LQFYYVAQQMQSEANKPGPPSWLRTILIGRRPKWTLVRIAVLVLTCYIVFGFLVLVIRIEGPSMLPNYRTGRINFVNRLAYLRREPQRGDVVAIRLSGTEYNYQEFVHDLVRLRLNFDRLSRPSVMYMKRVVGRPGETIEFAGGRLLINGEPLDEPYVKSRCRWEMQPRKLGPDEYFVVGDNRAMPIDDHEHGVPLRNHIVGKVLL